MGHQLNLTSYLSTLGLHTNMFTYTVSVIKLSIYTLYRSFMYAAVGHACHRERLLALQVQEHDARRHGLAQE